MMKRTLKRGVALLLVGVMMMAMMSVSAFGAGEGTVTNTVGKKISIKQTIELDTNENVPAAVFKYGITGTPAVPAIEDVTFIADGAAEKSFTVDLSSAFSTPGVYTYTISQTSVESIFSTAKPLTLTVYVTNDGLKAGGEYTYTLETEGVTGKVEGFKNGFDTKNLTFSKTVAGNMGDKSKAFTFNADINAGEVCNGDVYDVVVTKDGVDSNASITVENVGGVWAAKGEYQLADGDSVTIYGIPVSANYTVKETKEAGYTTTAVITGNGTFDASTATATGTLSETATVAYTNTYDVSVGTGIIMTFAPYVLMVVAAAAIGFVFFRRRQHDC